MDVTSPKGGRDRQRRGASKTRRPGASHHPGWTIPARSRAEGRRCSHPQPPVQLPISRRPGTSAITASSPPTRSDGMTSVGKIRANSSWPKGESIRFRYRVDPPRRRDSTSAGLPARSRLTSPHPGRSSIEARSISPMGIDRHQSATPLDRLVVGSTGQVLDPLSVEDQGPSPGLRAQGSAVAGRNGQPLGPGVALGLNRTPGRARGPNRPSRPRGHR